MNVDVSRWRRVGGTANTTYYEIEDGVLAGLPNDGARDDGVTARQNTEFQNAYFRACGRPGVIVVFFDRMVSQDKAARRVYQTEIDTSYTLGSCLVSASPLSRAMASFSLGFGKPRIPVKLSRDLEAALLWARELKRTSKENRT